MRFFFYGTLMAGSGNPVSDRIHNRLRVLGQATTRGRLFAIPTAQGWYPAFLADSGGTEVLGMAYDALPEWTREDLALLDAYEAYYPDRPDDSEYLRQPVGIRCGGDGEELAEAYVYHAALPDEAVPLPRGDFRRFLSESGVPGYRIAVEQLSDVFPRSSER